MREILADLLLEDEVDPFAYMQDAFERIADQLRNRLEEFLPDQWLAARRHLPLKTFPASRSYMLLLGVGSPDGYPKSIS